MFVLIMEPVLTQKAVINANVIRAIGEMEFLAGMWTSAEIQHLTIVSTVQGVLTQTAVFHAIVNLGMKGMEEYDVRILTSVQMIP